MSMEKQIIKQWTSKEQFETAYITIYKVGDSSVVEIDYVNRLDELEEKWRKEKSRKIKKEIEIEYKQTAEQMNRQYKKPLHSTSL